MVLSNRQEIFDALIKEAILELRKATLNSLVTSYRIQTSNKHYRDEKKNMQH